MRKWAIVSIFVYALGIPCWFAWVLSRYSTAIKADQGLFMLGTGDSAATNSCYSTRRRFSQLYKLFVPRYHYWRLVLTLRKFAIVFVAIMLPSAPMLQASLLTGIIFFSYAVHVHCKPYFEADNHKRLAGVVRDGAVKSFIVPLNRVESGYLVTSMIMLLAGMVFQSGYLAVSSNAYMFLVVVVRVAL